MYMATLFLFIFLIPFVASAYLDPGTGSFIIHVIVGGIVGVSYAVRVFWRNIKNTALFVASKLKRSKPSNIPHKHHDEVDKGV